MVVSLPMLCAGPTSQTVRSHLRSMTAALSDEAMVYCCSPDYQPENVQICTAVMM